MRKVTRKEFADCAHDVMQQMPARYYKWADVIGMTMRVLNARYPDGWAKDFLPYQALAILVKSHQIRYDQSTRTLRIR